MRLSRVLLLGLGVLFFGVLTGCKAAQVPQQQHDPKAVQERTPAAPGLVLTPGTRAEPTSASAPAASQVAPATAIESVKAPASALTGVVLGTLRTHKALVDIPAGAFPADALITLSIPQTVPPMDSLKGEMLGLPVSISAGERATRLDRLMKVILEFDPTRLPPGTEADAIWVAYSDGKNDWEYFRPRDVDLTAGTLTFESGHLSLFGATKIADKERIKKWVHSNVITRKIQSDIINKTVDDMAKKAIDHVLKDQLGMRDETVSHQVMSSLLKDDEYRDIADKLRGKNADPAEAVQTLNRFVGKKIVQTVAQDMGKEKAMRSRFLGALNDVAGSGAAWAGAAAQAAGHLAESNFEDAARVIGEKIADTSAMVQVFKAGKEVIAARIEIWKDAEVEAAYRAFRFGTEGSRYGYTVAPGDFDTLWNQMRAIDDRLKLEAVARESENRRRLGLPPLSEEEADRIRARVRTELESEFKERSKIDAEVDRQAALELELTEVFKERGLLQSASGFNYAVDTLEFRLEAVFRLRDKVLRDARSNGVTRVTNADIADLVAQYLSYSSSQEARKAYNELFKRKFGVDLEAASHKVAVTPATATLALGQKLELQASITGADPRSPIWWSARAGSLSAPEGASVTYTAPTEPGNYTVEASVSADGRMARTAVEVKVVEGVLALTDTKVSSGQAQDGARYTVNASPGSVSLSLDAPVGGVTAVAKWQCTWSPPPARIRAGEQLRLSGKIDGTGHSTRQGDGRPLTDRSRLIFVGTGAIAGRTTEIWRILGSVSLPVIPDNPRPDAWSREFEADVPPPGLGGWELVVACQAAGPSNIDTRATVTYVYERRPD